MHEMGGSTAHCATVQEGRRICQIASSCCMDLIVTALEVALPLSQRLGISGRLHYVRMSMCVSKLALFVFLVLPVPLVHQCHCCLAITSYCCCQVHTTVVGILVDFEITVST